MVLLHRRLRFVFHKFNINRGGKGRRWQYLRGDEKLVIETNQVGGALRGSFQDVGKSV